MSTPEFRRNYVQKKVDGWIQTVKKLSGIATSEPHAAFATFTHCIQGQWTFLSHSMPDIVDLFQPLETIIRTVFIKSLLKNVNDLERDMLSLPTRMGGLGLLSHSNSEHVSEPLVRDRNLILILMKSLRK